MEIKGKIMAGMFRAVILVFIGMLLVPLAAASTFEDINISPISDTKQKPEKIESVLDQLMKAEKRDDFAEAHGLYLKDDKVRVIIELNNTEVSEVENVLKGYDTVMETYYKNLIQALVPVDDLIALSEEPGVNYIRTPLPAHPQETPEAQIPLIYTWLLIGIVVAIIAAIIAVSLSKRRRG